MIRTQTSAHQVVRNLLLILTNFHSKIFRMFSINICEFQYELTFIQINFSVRVEVLYFCTLQVQYCF